MVVDNLVSSSDIALSELRNVALIDTDALRNNYRLIKQRVNQTVSQNTQVLAVVKANAYGHGIDIVSQALEDCDGFGVAILEEAMTLRLSGVTRPIVLLEGVLSRQAMEQAGEYGFDVVIHHPEQLQFVLTARLKKPVKVWLKFNTGMHRLGFALTDVPRVFQQLVASAKVSGIVLMSHFATADEPESALLAEQRERFVRTVALLNAERPASFPATALTASVSNSAGIFATTDAYFDWVRPGLALYGGSPLDNVAANALGLSPVMELRSRVIALRDVDAGESVGYGATWIASEPCRIAIVGIGYGDGYPRHMDERAEVLVNGVLCPLVGRVSMDMLAVLLVGAARDITLADTVTLWGSDLPLERVAAAAKTINYELLCQVTTRVPRIIRTQTHG